MNYKEEKINESFSLLGPQLKLLSSLNHKRDIQEEAGLQNEFNH